MAEGGTDRSTSEAESDLGHDSLYSRHSKNYVENLSVEICTIMNRLGYGEEIRRWRAEKYREWDWLANEQPSLEDLITVGSKAEGLTSYNESDRDILHVIHDVLCVEDGSNLHTIPYNTEVYRMDTRVYPGHCILFLERKRPRRYSIIHNALCDNGKGDVLLSSCLLVDEHLTLQRENISFANGDGFVQLHERAGPSLPVSFLGSLPADIVVSLRCHCPNILQRWAARPRHWPSPTIVQKVVSLGAYLTPVGFKGSENKHMEWRICFNTGELELVNNLNGTHAKVYVLLKMILKNVLRPCKKEITSYVMKNIVLWQAESNPQNKFNARSLFHWLHEGLRELRTAIVTQQLSYYMIPERNLMAASGLQNKQQSKWVADITDMMAEGPRVILRLPRIRQAVIASPEPLLWFNKRRIEMEILQLEDLKRHRHLSVDSDLIRLDMTDAILHDMRRRRLEIMMEMILRMLEEGCDINLLKNNPLMFRFNGM